MAYRGRVLVEIDTKLNSSCSSEKDVIRQTDVVKVQVRINEDIFKKFQNIFSILIILIIILTMNQR